jgi:hypothetical protein
VNVPAEHGFWSWWKRFVKRHIVDEYPQNFLSIDLRLAGFPASLPKNQPMVPASRSAQSGMPYFGA